MKIFDVHAHREVVANNICDHTILACASYQDWSLVSKISEKNIFKAFGIHPFFIDGDSLANLDKLESILKENNAIAVGEIGVDKKGVASIELQIEVFRKQLKIAVANNLPVVIHCFGHFQRALEVMIEEDVKKVGGVMHAYSGSYEMAKNFMKQNLKISISPLLLNENALKIKELVHKIELEQLVVESDYPYFNNQDIRKTVSKIAEIKKLSEEEISEKIYKNSLEIFNIEPYK